MMLYGDHRAGKGSMERTPLMRKRFNDGCDIILPLRDLLGYLHFTTLISQTQRR